MLKIEILINVQTRKMFQKYPKTYVLVFVSPEIVRKSVASTYFFVFTSFQRVAHLEKRASMQQHFEQIVG